MRRLRRRSNRGKAWRGWEANVEKDGSGDGKGEGEVGVGLSKRQKAVLAYADAMTVGIKVSEEIFAWRSKSFDERKVVEITATVAAYNSVSRFVVALDVGDTSEKEKKQKRPF